MKSCLLWVFLVFVLNAEVAYAKKNDSKIHESVVLIQYKEAIKNIFSKIWFKEDYFEKGWFCKVTVTQDRRGRIRNKSQVICNTEDKGFVISVEDAVDKLTSLPKARKSFFQKEIGLIFYQND